MNLTSFLANKCFEYLLKCDADYEPERSCLQVSPSSRSSLPSQVFIQPPWSLNREIFTSLCDGCGDCISACDHNILTLSNNGYPQVDFSLGSCNFCGSCAESCSREAFKYDPLLPPWELHVQINSKCLTKNNVICSTCIDQCDKEAIVIPRIIDKDKEPRVLTDLCDGCGACFKACPINAIEIYQLEDQGQP